MTKIIDPAYLDGFLKQKEKTFRKKFLNLNYEKIKKKISLNNCASARSRKRSHENASASRQFPLASLPSRSPLYLHLITFAFVNAPPRAKRQALMEPGVAR